MLGGLVSALTTSSHECDYNRFAWFCCCLRATANEVNDLRALNDLQIP